MLVNDLNCRVDVYDNVKIKTEFGDYRFEIKKIKTIWAKIIPQGGNEIYAGGNSKYANVSHKIITRGKALECFSPTMFFKYKTQLFDVKYLNYNYKDKDKVELFCNLREGDNNFIS